MSCQISIMHVLLGGGFVDKVMTTPRRSSSTECGVLAVKYIIKFMYCVPILRKNYTRKAVH